MPNKKPKGSNKPKSVKSWSLYSTLHRDVLQLLQEDNLAFKFHNDDNDNSYSHEYDTYVMGRFTCHNDTCHAGGWASRRIPITIRMYDGQRYNARVYHQGCKSCKSLSRPQLHDSYAERVAYRIKKWCGIRMAEPFYSTNNNKKPHKRELCEGCKVGHCNAY
ncbi:hypothetical protein LX36DRAFT_734717 [Colletotrichum falcatum]|nr:hypothetical protein LX36DRAFT_734717 [Colletotrichum falcatum]